MISTSRKNLYWTIGVGIFFLILLLYQQVHFQFAVFESKNTIVYFKSEIIGIFFALVLMMFNFKIENPVLRFFVAFFQILLVAFLMSQAFNMANTTSFFDREVADYLYRDVWSVLLLLGVYFLFYAIIGNAKIGSVVSTLVLAVCMFISTFVLQSRGDRLLYTDIFAVKTALDVVGGYKFTITSSFFGAMILIFCALVISLRIFSLKTNWKVRVVTLLASVGLYFGFVYTEPTDHFESDIPSINSYVYHFFVNRELNHYKKPDNYTEERLLSLVEEHKDASILEELGVDYTPSEAIQEAFPDSTIQKPNIIVVMNESFSDLSSIGLEFSEDPISNYHSLAENYISGYTYVDVFGGGTPDSEYAFLTGNSLYFVPNGARPYQLFVNNQTPSLVSTLLDQGYTADAIHPCPKGNWNRNVVYPLLGFQNFYNNEDMDEFSNLRTYVDDTSTYNWIEHLYENKDKDTPMFVFDVTMQNHGPYVDEYSLPESIEITNATKDYPGADTYITLVNDSDESFAQLVDYFSTADEPTIICMFGDHQPNTTDGLTEDYLGGDLGSLDVETKEKAYETPFIIWANYDIPNLDIDQMSINYLSTLLLEVSGDEMPLYNHYLAWLYTQFPILNRVGIETNTGEYYTQKTLPKDYKEVLQNYRDLEYNNMIDSANRFDSIYYLGE